MSNQDVIVLDAELNHMILSGKALEGFEKFYAEEVVMQEGIGATRKGKVANRKYEEQFFASIAEFHGAELLGAAAQGDRSYSEWSFDVTLKNGTRNKSTQVAARKWKDGKIVWERFYAAAGG